LEHFPVPFFDGTDAADVAGLLEDLDIFINGFPIQCPASAISGDLDIFQRI